MLHYGTLGLLRQSHIARRMLIYVGFSGVLWGAMQFGEIIARKSLGASQFQVTLLTMIMPVTSLTSIWWGRFLLGRDQRAILWFTGTFGLLTVATGFFLKTYSHLLLIYIIYFITFAIQGTARNRPLQQHIPAKQTGGLYGASAALRFGLAGLVAGAGGWYLEKTPLGWQYLFLTVAAIGFVGIANLASIPTTNKPEVPPEPIRNWLIEPWTGVYRLLKRRPDYLRFEAAFMLHGIAFMVNLPTVPIYLVDDLQWDYTIIGLSRGTVYQFVMIAAVPIAGKIFDRSTPHRLAAGSFALGALYPILLVVAKSFSGTTQVVLVMAGFAVFGIAMSGVSILWNIASMRFTGPGEDAGLYQSVHIAATGIRGMFAPLLGYLILYKFGTSAALLVSTGAWIAASAGMIAARLWDFKAGAAVSLRV